MADTHVTLLKRYLKLPDRLETAIAGLSESQLDLTLDSGWSIREYVHHTVEGELIWQVNCPRDRSRRMDLRDRWRLEFQATQIL